MSRSDRPIAVIGAGFSGTLTALQLLARTTHTPILLCERGERFARGTAYGTDDPGHLLNVRASNMSAFPDRPDDFVRWLERSGPHDDRQVRKTPAGTFVSRHLYGTYLTALLSDAVARTDGASRLILMADEVVDLDPDDDGYQLVLAMGHRVPVFGVVLAAGSGLPTEPEVGPCFTNPWGCPFAEGLDRSRPVVVIGSGLTMVDVTLQLRHAGFDGTVIAISRRGLRPHAHAATTPWTIPTLTAHERGSLSWLLRRLRVEAVAAATAGVDWRSVVDSLRAITSELWQSLDEAAQQRFLRHARPWWDIHRHRMAVPVGQQIDALVSDGRLDVRAGCIIDIAGRTDGARVTYRPRGCTTTEVIDAQRVITATGASPPDRCGNTLLQHLMGRGLARLDRHGLGLDLDWRFAVLGASGEATPRLWALGPIGIGVLWECTAVPDIRQHAVQVANQIADAVSWREGGPDQRERQGRHPIGDATEREPQHMRAGPGYRSINQPINRNADSERL